MAGPFHLYGLCTAGAALLALGLMQCTRKKHGLSNEAVSMLENAGHLGLPIPEKLKDILAQLHNKTVKEPSDD